MAELGLPDDETRDLPSPDVADAFVLTFAEVGRGRQLVAAQYTPNCAKLSSVGCAATKVSK